MDNKACKKWLFLYFSESNISIFRSRRSNMSGHRKSKNNISNARSLVLQWHPSQHPQHVKQNLSKNNIYLADLSVYLHHLYFFFPRERSYSSLLSKYYFHKMLYDYQNAQKIYKNHIRYTGLNDCLFIHEIAQWIKERELRPNFFYWGEWVGS